MGEIHPGHFAPAPRRVPVGWVYAFGAAVGLVGLIAGALKLGFKLLILPLTLAWAAFKGAIGLVAGLLGLIIVVPLVIAFAVAVGIPLLILALVIVGALALIGAM